MRDGHIGWDLEIRKRGGEREWEEEVETVNNG
jgi:hypothetical protein